MRREFTKNQLKRLANIFDNAGQVFLATLVIPSIFQVEIDSKFMVPLGTVLTLGSWWTSLRIERFLDKYGKRIN